MCHFQDIVKSWDVSNSKISGMYSYNDNEEFAAGVRGGSNCLVGLTSYEKVRCAQDIQVNLKHGLYFLIILQSQGIQSFLHPTKKRQILLLDQRKSNSSDVSNLIEVSKFHHAIMVLQNSLGTERPGVSLNLACRKSIHLTPVNWFSMQNSAWTLGPNVQPMQLERFSEYIMIISKLDEMT